MHFIVKLAEHLSREDYDKPRHSPERIVEWEEPRGFIQARNLADAQKIEAVLCDTLMYNTCIRAVVHTSKGRIELDTDTLGQIVREHAATNMPVLPMTAE